MNSKQNSCVIFISIQILLHLSGIVCPKNKNQHADTNKPRPKLANMPLVLLEREGEVEYAFPRCFRQDSQGKKRDFTSAKNEKQVFFCPESSAKRLLWPTRGEHFHCKERPEPTVRKITTKEGENNCGQGRVLYSLGYKYSKTPIETWDGKTYWKEIYSFCYDTNIEEVAYVKYRILSPNLLSHLQLQRERSYYETKYRLEDFDDVEESLKEYANMIMTAMDKKEAMEQHMATKRGDDADTVPVSKYLTTMELGHPADMIFPNWKKPFYYAVNKGLLLRTLTKQWRKIGYFVRKSAQKKLGEIEIVAGTFPISETQLFGTFWKLVIYEKRAIAIILHNIFDKLTENDKLDRKSKYKTNRKKTEDVDEPEKIPGADRDTTKVDDKPSDIVTGYMGDREIKMEKFCTDICLDTGFQGIISRELKIPAYCCPPNVITDLLGWKDKYELLNLKNTLKDQSVIDDRCPKDPL